MSDWFPRFADLKSIEDLSKLIAYPIVIAAHLLQTGLVITVPEQNFTFSLPKTDNTYFLYLAAIAIFTCKASYISLLLKFFHAVIIAISKITELEFHSLIAVLLLAGGITGVLGSGTTTVTSLGLVQAWYYASFVVGFYLMAWVKENPI
jgi:hypothetical protein